MKKFAIVTLPLFLAACVSGDYVTNVTSDSYQEEYKTAKVEAPVVSQSEQTSVVEENVEQPVVKTAPVEQKVTQTTAIKPVATVVGPTKKQQEMNQRFGYTVQVVAVGTQNKVDSFVKMLPMTQQPVWENYKMVNGTKWFTVLYGDYATRLEAKKAIATLPATFQNLKPFVKSIDDIKNSEYPTLNKLN
ncbi:SPOR domain-containing protein [Vibrio artabrorum]|uniref:SPOR domain-containing protein n=1 Tax=Vibrio artabrorum TaxID=446374 RepID=UPI003552F912